MSQKRTQPKLQTTLLFMPPYPVNKRGDMPNLVLLRHHHWYLDVVSDPSNVVQALQNEVSAGNMDSSMDRVVFKALNQQSENRDERGCFRIGRT